MSSGHEEDEHEHDDDEIVAVGHRCLQHLDDDDDRFGLIKGGSAEELAVVVENEDSTNNTFDVAGLYTELYPVCMAITRLLPLSASLRKSILLIELRAESGG